MRTVRHDFGSVLKHVRNGEIVAITNRKKTVALLTPPPGEAPKRRQPWAALRTRLARLRAQPMARQTAAAMLTADRNRY